MRWTRSELLASPSDKVEFDEDVRVDSSEFHLTSRIRDVKNVHVSGEGFLDPDTDRFYADMHITGVMICPDAISDEDTEVPFETDSEEEYSFAPTEEDGVRIVNDEIIELLPAVAQAILMEVPLQVIREGQREYPRGEGWQVYSEADYEESRKDQVDPRLAGLKQFKNGKQ